MAVRPKQQAQLRARSGPQRTVAAQRVTPRLLAPGQRVRALPVFAALNFATPGEVRHTCTRPWCCPFPTACPSPRSPHWERH